MRRVVLGLAAAVLLAACGASSYAPVAQAPYFFGTPGASHEFVVRAHAFQGLEVALLMAPGTYRLPQNRAPDPFPWRCTATAFQGGRAIETINLQPRAWWHNGQGDVHAVSLGSFQQLGFLPRETRIVVRVARPLEWFGGSNPRLRVVLRPSPVP